MIFIKTENSLVKMKLFATAALATTVFAATKSRFTDDAAAGLVIEHDVSIGNRSRRDENRIDTCENSYREDIFPYSKSHGFNTCVFSSLLDFHRNNIRRAMEFIYENSDASEQHRGKQLVETTDGFHGIMDDWKILTGGRRTRITDETLDCGWEPLESKWLANKMEIGEDQIKEGFFRDCAGMCNLMRLLPATNDESSKKLVKETLNMFLMIIADYFGVMAQIKADTTLAQGELPQCVQKEGYWNEKQKEYIEPEWINSKKKPCTKADKCGQIVRNIFRKVSLFEDFSGPIPSLSEYDDAYKSDLTRLKDSSNFKPGQHGQKHRIIAKIFE